MDATLPRKKVQLGDRIIVCGRPEKAIVEAVATQSDGSVKITVDWGEFGKSRVYEHDEGSVWVPYIWVN